MIIKEWRERTREKYARHFIHRVLCAFVIRPEKRMWWKGDVYFAHIAHLLLKKWFWYFLLLVCSFSCDTNIVLKRKRTFRLTLFFISIYRHIPEETQKWNNKALKWYNFILTRFYVHQVQDIFQCTVYEYYLPQEMWLLTKKTRMSESRSVIK